MDAPSVPVVLGTTAVVTIAGVAVHVVRLSEAVADDLSSRDGAAAADGCI
jgi:hypothetical protein